LGVIGIFFPFLVCCAKKNLATLVSQKIVSKLATTAILC
jgi:hypothetical protein